MRRLLCLLSFLTLALLSCDDEVNFNDVGVITGQDFRLCACCGGWFIEIGDEIFRFNRLPNNSDIELSEDNFPLVVFLNWRNDPEACIGDEILIEKINR